MRIASCLLLLFQLVISARAQQTLVREAPNDSFDLSCPKCTLRVADMALTNGQHAIPMNMKKPVALNLLLWKYYDDILRKETYMAKEPYWTQGTLLLDEVPEEELLSLHLNLVWTDSLGTAHRIYLVAAGLTKSQLARLPVVCIFDADTYALQRFAAVALITETEDIWETYDCVEGSFTLDSLDPKSGAVKGSFEFTGSRVGMEKLGFFLNGTFQR